jgi:transposase
MLKIVYPICCDIDVHKKFLVAYIAFTNANGVTTYKLCRFSTFTSGLRKLVQGLASNFCTDVYMESTGKYCAHSQCV